MREWHVFVDESGAFEADDPCPTLGAVVVPAPDIGAFESWARGRLESIVPHVLWPPHTTYLNLPIYHAFAAEAAGTATAEDQVVLDYVRASAGQKVDDIVSRLRDRMKVHRDRFSTFNDWLMLQGGEPAQALVRIESRMRETDAGIRGMLIEVDGRCPGAFVASSAETFDCEAAFHEHGRYFVVLEALVERIHDAIARLGEDAVVTVSALELTVDIDSVTRRPLDRDLLDQPIERVRLVRAGSCVTLVTGNVVRFDAHVTAGFILADFVANRFGYVLRHQGGPTLSRAHETLSLRLGLPVSSGNPSGSHLAASGTARGMVAVLRAGSTGAVWPAGCRRWARSQAEQWAAIRP